MAKLKIKGQTDSQEKHDAFLSAGYKLKSTKQKEGLIVRTYTN